jgi:hypothetical protein
MSKYLDWSATRSSADIRIQSADDEPTPRFGLANQRRQGRGTASAFSTRQSRAAETAARLTCLPADDTRPWADYTDLAAAVDLTPEDDGLTDPNARREAKVELDALACQIYGLDVDAFRFLMNELFMTPEHRAHHEQIRDAVAEIMGE